jgi:hypothetical protein
MKYEAGGVKGKSGAPLSVELPVPAPGALDITVKDGSGQTVAALAWQVTLPDGTVKSGNTQGDGRITVGGATGDCKVVFPALDKDAPAAGSEAAKADTPAASGGGADSGAQPQPEPKKDEPPPAPKNAAEKRQAILAKAREYVGKIDPRAGPDGKRIGWELLKDIHDTSFNFDIFKDPSAKEKIPAPHGKYCSWCGIFALAMAKKAGAVAPEVKWNVGGKVTGGLDQIKGQVDGIQPGDIIIMDNGGLWHHAIVSLVEGDTVSTIDGNSFDPSTMQDQSVVEHHQNRHKHEINAWYKTVADE